MRNDARRIAAGRVAADTADRIDDETRGVPISTNWLGATADIPRRARPCDICKRPHMAVDAFYHQLCPDCAALSHAKRDARTDLTGKRALLTG